MRHKQLAGHPFCRVEAPGGEMEDKGGLKGGHSDKPPCALRLQAATSYLSRKNNRERSVVSLLAC